MHFERVIYEGFAPHQVPVMVECLTDNVNRTASEMRVLFRKGQLGSTRLGRVGLQPRGHHRSGTASAHKRKRYAEVAAIESGAQDFEPADDEGVYRVPDRRSRP
ncbi:MAG: YebC/PmpR family DNA-binding transcriptional regulator [Rhodoferax sp.]|nr:YebC/PmpR family DNA-binding transcriptional regulator [Rhodoferax sp.]